jgi:hypothetical protein
MTTKHLTFCHRFSTTLKCTLCAQDTPPDPGSCANYAFEWVGVFRKKFVPEYRRWVLCTNQTLADHWQTSILYALGIADDQTELWEFKPGETPKLVKKLNVGIS